MTKPLQVEEVQLTRQVTETVIAKVSAEEGETEKSNNSRKKKAIAEPKKGHKT